MGTIVNKKITSTSKIIKSNQKKTISGLWPWFVFPTFAFLLYGNTLGHGWALDDYHTILSNSAITQGISGIGKIFSQPHWYNGVGYRPITAALFAFGYSISSGTPLFFHLINVLLYSLILVLLFWFLSLLFQTTKKSTLTAITLIFAAHPIHTEVVSNIKSCDELLAMLFQVAALYTYIYFLKTKGPRSLLLLSITCILSLCALFSKESSTTLLGLLFLTHLYKSECFYCKKTIALPILLFINALGVFVVLHFEPLHSMKVTSPLNNSLLLITDLPTRLAASAEILVRYVIWLLLPISQRYEYGFDVLSNFAKNPLLLTFSVATIISLSIVTIWAIKRKNMIGYGLGWFFISVSITANFFFLIGATMAERFVFVPSLGIILCLVIVLQRIFLIAKTPNRIINLVFLVFLLYLSIQTVYRSSAWKDNATLFRRDGLTTIGLQSANAQASLGNILLFKASTVTNPIHRTPILDSAIHCLKRSLSLYPNNRYALGNLGLAFDLAEIKDSALLYYGKTRNLYAADFISRYNSALIFLSQNKIDSAKALVYEARSINPTHVDALLLQADVFAVSGKETESLLKYDSVLALNPLNKRALRNKELTTTLLQSKNFKQKP